MSDLKFQLTVMFTLQVVCLAAGAVAMWSFAVQGPVECSVTVQHGSHKAEYVTECRI